MNEEEKKDLKILISELWISDFHNKHIVLKKILEFVKNSDRGKK